MTESLTLMRAAGVAALSLLAAGCPARESRPAPALPPAASDAVSPADFAAAASPTSAFPEGALATRTVTPADPAPGGRPPSAIGESPAERAAREQLAHPEARPLTPADIAARGAPQPPPSAIDPPSPAAPRTP